ncbi:MAG: hypothetical protein V1821_03315 [bacterium]
MEQTDQLYKELQNEIIKLPYQSQSGSKPLSIEALIRNAEKLTARKIELLQLEDIVVRDDLQKIRRKQRELVAEASDLANQSEALKADISLEIALGTMSPELVVENRQEAQQLLQEAMRIFNDQASPLQMKIYDLETRAADLKIALQENRNPAEPSFTAAQEVASREETQP